MQKQWKNSLSLLVEEGERSSSRNGDMLEIVGFTLPAPDSTRALIIDPIRKVDPFYACAELIWYLTMQDNTKFLQMFAPSYKNYTEDGVHAFGAYGHRWANSLSYCMLRPASNRSIDNQLETAIAVLRKYPDSRQAIISMWDSGDLIHASLLDKKDLPCTLSLQFIIRNNKLNLIVTMRSNDAWMGLPYDSFCFMTLQRIVADCLNVEVGKYVHNVGSFHVYDKHQEKMEAVLKSSYDDSTTPINDNLPFAGRVPLRKLGGLAHNFVVSVANGEDKILIPESLQPSTIFADLAYVCASKFNQKYIDEIYCKRLRTAVEMFLESKENES